MSALQELLGEVSYVELDPAWGFEGVGRDDTDPEMPAFKGIHPGGIRFCVFLGFAQDRFPRAFPRLSSTSADMCSGTACIRDRSRSSMKIGWSICQS